MDKQLKGVLKIFMWSGILTIFGYLATAISISNANYAISCNPDESTIQYNGFLQTCSYQWKGASAKTEDVAFCFTDKLSSGKVYYLEGKQDITSQFNFNYISQLSKKNCYVISSVTWQPQETKTILITYSSPYIKNNKWDTLFGKVSTHTVDLMLDPLFNATHYEIGTNRSSYYYWSGNSDIFFTNATLNNLNATNLGSGIISSAELFDGFENGVGNWSNVSTKPTVASGATYVFSGSNSLNGSSINMFNSLGMRYNFSNLSKGLNESNIINLKIAVYGTDNYYGFGIGESNGTNRKYYEISGYENLSVIKYAIRNISGHPTDTTLYGGTASCPFSTGGVQNASKWWYYDVNFTNTGSKIFINASVYNSTKGYLCSFGVEDTNRFLNISNPLSVYLNNYHGSGAGAYYFDEVNVSTTNINTPFLASSFIQTKGIQLPINVSGFNMTIQYFGDLNGTISTNNYTISNTGFTHENNCVSNCNNYCYQQFANISTVCGGNGSGSYNVVYLGAGTPDPTNMTDGNWSTGTRADIGGTNAFPNIVILYDYFYKPVNASLFQSRIIVRTDDANGIATNYSLAVPSACFSQSPITILVSTETRTNNNRTTIQCYNGAGYPIVQQIDGNSRYVYETAMQWNIPNYTVSTLNLQAGFPSYNANSVLAFQLLLNDNTTTVYNVSMDFTPLNTTVYFNASEKVTGLPVLYNVTMINTIPMGNNYSLTNVQEIQNLTVESGTFSVTMSGNNWLSNCTNTSYVVNSGFTQTFPLCQFYNSVLNVSATNYTGGAINNFSVNITYSDGVTEKQNTTSGLVQFNLSKNTTYTLLLDALGFSYVNASYFVNKTADNYTFQNTYTTNSLNVTIKNELTSALIPEAVSITISSTTFNNNYSTSTGYFYVDNLPADNYEIKFNSANYTERRYYFTVVNRANLLLTARLLPNASSTIIGVYVKTDVDDPIYQATVNVQRQYNGTYTTVAQKVTDITGLAVFNLQEGYKYQWVISASGYTPRQFFLEPYSANSPYTFKLYQGAFGFINNTYSGIYYQWSPLDQELNQTNVTFSWTTISTLNILESTTLTTQNGIVNLTSSPSGGTLTQTVDLSNYSGTYNVIYSFKAQNYSLVTFNVSYYVVGQQGYQNASLQQAMNTFKRGLNTQWQGIVAMFIILIAIVTVAQMSGGNPIPATIIGFVGLITFAVLGWLSPISVTFVVLIGAGMMYFTRGGH